MVQVDILIREIAHRMQYSASTITRFIQRFNRTGSLNYRPRPGRQRATTAQQDRLQHLRDSFRTAVQTARETVGVHRRQIEANTVRLSASLGDKLKQIR